MVVHDTTEILEMIRRGVEVYIFSLRTPPEDRAVTKFAHQLESKTIYSPFFLSLRLWFANLYYLWKKPGVYLKTLARTVTKNFSNVNYLMKSLAIFPKSAFFARVAEKLALENIHGGTISAPATSASIFSSLTGIPYSCTAHGSDIYQYPPPDMVEKVRGANPFITISEFNKRHLTSEYQRIRSEDVQVVYAGIDLGFFKRGREVDKSKDNETRLLTVTNTFRPIKGLPYLIRACRILRERGYRFQCDIVGDEANEELRQKIRREIAVNDVREVINLHGNVLTEDILSYYETADIFVLPSIREGLPSVLKEAAAMRLPSVATNIYGVPELVTNGVEGLLVRPRDAAALANSIQSLIDNPALRLEMGRNARTKVERYFDIQNTAQQLEGLFF